MAFSTKKHEPPNPAGTRLTNSDFPQLAKEIDALHGLEAERERIVAAYRRADGVVHEQTPQEGRIKKLTGQFLEKVGAARPAQPAQASEEEGLDLPERRAAADAAIEQQQRKIQALGLSLQAEIYSSGWDALDFQSRQRMARAVVELAEAVQGNESLAREMANAGAISGPCFGSRLWLNTSACPTLPHCFRTMNLNEFKRNNANLLKD